MLYHQIFFLVSTFVYGIESKVELFNKTGVRFPGRVFGRCEKTRNDQNISVTYNNCHHPDCSCPSTSIPYFLLKEQTPQFVIIILEGPITTKVSCDINRILGHKRRNPNGCPVAITLVPHHIGTDYCVLRKLTNRGYDVLLHPETRESEIADEEETDVAKYWKAADFDKWRIKLQDEKERLEKLAQIKIKGYRMSRVVTATEAQMRAAKEVGFEFDSTNREIQIDRQPLGSYVSKGDKDKIPFFYWPYTLDNQDALPCKYNEDNVKFCPKTANFKGMWELPKYILGKVIHNDSVGFNLMYGCEQFDSPYLCTPNGDAESAFDILMTNLEQRYLTNRAPLIINMKASTLSDHVVIADALEAFISKAQEIYKDDVWFATASNLVQWLKAGRGIQVDELINYSKFSCNYYKEFPCEPQGHECPYKPNSQCPEVKEDEKAKEVKLVSELSGLFGDGKILVIVQTVFLLILFVFL
ncbi:DgyrCDS12555 [Dimorphilus gyrociliatus]|uniref:DgyrCDS12555 n=1 Tax=Dimorphilus gyrociliatus TaxID=2664684 RepID=A0A7I8W7L7_9ANNE|nr:DgyrCDS12555 [Dimorphilus gyrociliatus]